MGEIVYDVAASVDGCTATSDGGVAALPERRVQVRYRAH
jgi:hypothetical protein